MSYPVSPKPAIRPGEAHKVALTSDATPGMRLQDALQSSLPWVLMGWMGGVLILSVRLLLGFVGVRQWRRNLEPLTNGLDLRHLAGLTGLQFLSLSDTSVTDAGLAHLELLTGLWELHLGSTEITGPGLEHLKGLTGLKWLNLADTQVTEAGLAP